MAKLVDVRLDGTRGRSGTYKLCVRAVRRDAAGTAVDPLLFEFEFVDGAPPLPAAWLGGLRPDQLRPQTRTATCACGASASCARRWRR
jgi:hypothetical protein